jgi:hypothetical protein
MSGNENRGTKQTCNGATVHVLVELDIACRDANGTKYASGRGTAVLGAY